MCWRRPDLDPAAREDGGLHNDKKRQGQGREGVITSWTESALSAASV